MTQPIDFKTEKHEASIKKLQAETRKANAEADATEFDAETSRLMAQSADLAHVRDLDRWKWDQAGDIENRILHFTDTVTPGTAAAAIDVLSRWDRIDAEAGRTDEPYEIQLCSPGGHVVAGFKLYAYIKNLAKRRPVRTVATGMCASIATVIHQAGSERLIEDGCSYMIHDPSGQSVGTLGDLEDTTKWMQMIKARMHQILAERSNLTIEEIADKSSRRDWWFFDDEAVVFGFADEVR